MISPKKLPVQQRVLMVSPDYFDVEYAINAFMRDKNGELKRVDKAKAHQQWKELGDVYRKLGLEVTIIQARPNLPDMVFAANQSLTYWSLDKNVPAVVMSKMTSKFRKPEVEFFSEWYESEHYSINEIAEEINEERLTFEGNGDAVVQGTRAVIWAANGPRTSPAVADELRRLTGYEVVPLTLRHELFYHLDTCFSILDSNTVAYLPAAFDATDVEKIKKGFSRQIEIGLDECKNSFAGNCHSPDGKHVILQKGSPNFCERLKANGFEPIEVDTSEFMKSGGSVFCMKMMAY